MKSEEIKSLFFQFEAAASDLEGVECWSARELQILLGYSKWENFEKVIQKAKDACKNAGEEMGYHFPDIRKTIPMPKGAEKEIDDMLLTRYACYLIAQNGNSRPIADFLPTISIKAKDLAAEMTGLNVQSKDLKGQTKIEKEHVDNNLAVRNMLTQRGIVPEKLPPAEDVKKLQRKLDGDEKELLKSPKKKK
ncbi:MAG TPA: hypothetical protein PKH79_03290 [Prolixibacteraceae bacterium]|nr:hypothetical protein [Prolixibacteraceae bacterium]